MISYSKFLEGIRDQFEQNKKELQKQLKNARDEYAIINNWRNDIQIELSDLEIRLQIENLDNFFNDLQSEYLCDNQLTDRGAFKKTLLKYGDRVNPERLKILQRHKVLIETKNHINNEIDFTPDIEKTENPKWNSTNKTEFIQLMHGLIEIGRIDIGNQKGKWETIRKISEFFSVELSKNAISNFSKSYKNSNNDYSPKIFQELMENFEKKMDN